MEILFKPVQSVLGQKTDQRSKKDKSAVIEAVKKPKARSAHRKFIAEAPKQTISETQIEADLAALNKGTPGALEKLLTDIGGSKNLSSFRDSTSLDASRKYDSLLDLCAYLGYANAATALLDNGFQYQSTSPDGKTVQNDFPPRYQWDSNGGYCGETSLLSAALANGEYVSQYDLRQMAAGAQTGGVYPGMLVLGNGGDDIAQPNAGYVAKLLHLNFTEWNTAGGNTKDFMAWVKAQVDAGKPVIIGVYMNQYTWNRDTDPDAGDDEYDHIITITGFGTDKNGKEVVYYSDNGLYGDSQSDSPYEFSCPVDQFMGTRQQANIETDHPNNPHYLYTLPSEDHHNCGIAVNGVTDPNKETLPVRMVTNINDEPYQVPEKKNTRPKSVTVSALACVSGLTPGKTYKIYVYDDVSKIPDSDFNGHAGQAMQCITFTATGSNYTLPLQFQSDETRAVRVVPADGK